jgi:predicted porin
MGWAGDRENVASWQVGGQIGYRGALFGAGFVDAGDSGMPKGQKDDERSAWNIGATYDVGSYAVGVSYVDEDWSQFGDYRAAGVGGVYTVTPGLTLNADVVGFTSRDSAKVKLDTGYLTVLSTKVAF